MVPGPASTELGQSYDSDEIVAGVGAEVVPAPVSYTHLTLPTN